MNLRFSRRLGGVVAAAAMATTALTAAAPAQAFGPVPLFSWSLLFSQIPTMCSPGTEADGFGSTFQNRGEAVVTADFGSLCNGAQVTYNSTLRQPGRTGSGSCVTAMVNHLPNSPFCGTDIPYTDQQWLSMIGGAPSILPAPLPSLNLNLSPINTLPVAIGSVAVAFNESCMANGDPISGATISAIYHGSIKTWDKVKSSCPADAIHPLSRNANSGTTAAFKAYLFHKDVTSGNPPAPAGTGWPAPPDATPFPAPAVTSCTAGAISGNTPMANCISGTSGSIGYVDWSDASIHGLTIASVDNADPTDFETPGQGVSQANIPNCQEAALAVPTPPLAQLDFAHVDLTNPAAGYGICTYTYDLAFMLPAQSGTANDAQATTTRAYLTYSCSDDAGQAQFATAGYIQVPPIQQIVCLEGALTILPVL